MSGRCLWCGRPFTFRKVGAHAKKFCSAPCKNRYHTAARRWIQRAITDGQLSVTDLNRHSPDAIQIRGNRTTVPPPRELYPFRSHPMA